MTTTTEPEQDPRHQIMAPDPSPALKRLCHLVDNAAVDTVLLALPDMAGAWRGKSLPATAFLDRIEAGAPGWPLCSYVLATDPDMNLYDDFALTSLSTGLHDLVLRPDLDTLRVLPWRESTALVVADAVNPSGHPIAVAPRQMLRDQIGLLAEHGLTAHVGYEAEWTVFQGTAERIAQHGQFRPITARSLDLALDHPPAIEAYMEELRFGLGEAGLRVRTIQTEHGPGQFEMTFDPAGPLAAADTHLVLQDAVRRCATAAGWTALWMAAPTTGGATSGLHIHLSLRHIDGEPLVTSDGHRLPDVVEHAIAGLLDALPDLAPLYAPYPNSYKRFRADTGAPTRFVWGTDNRTCAVGVVNHGDGVHWEVRVAGADANAYLVLAAILAAIRHGIDHQLALPKPCVGNAYLDADDAPQLPRTLDEALAAFRDSALPGRLFTERVAQHYATAAAHTLETHHRTVTDIELHHALGS